MKATHWLKVPNTSSTKKETPFLYTPCDPKTKGAVAMKMIDIEPAMVQLSPISEVVPCLQSFLM